MSVYLPINDRRQTVIKDLTSYIKTCRQANPTDRLLVGGDLNGVATPEGRGTPHAG
jgi:hypothetical protein